jgi:hypothetical protein
MPCAALFGLSSEDEEILHLLLDVLGWQNSTISDVSVKQTSGSQLVFVGYGEAQAALKASKLASSAKFVLVGSAVDLDAIDVGNPGRLETLASPIDLKAAEILINSAAAAFINGNAH